MWLQMIVGNIMLEECPITYDGLIGAMDKQHYQERLAVEMKARNMRQVKQAMQDPVFFVIGQESRINNLPEEPYGRGMSDEQFIRSLKREFAGQPWALK